MNKGGFKKKTTKTKPSITKEITFNEFSLDLIKDTIISKLPIWEMDAGLDAGLDMNFNRSKGERKEKQSGGTNYFVEDFNSWLKIEADPLHDFKMKHQFDTKYLSEKLLIRTYHDILERTSTDFENSILIRIIQDPNPSQGISLKYCRFYKLKSAGRGADNEDTNMEEQSLWERLESNFDAIDRDSHFKFYILNAPISGTGSREFTGAYRKIVPLSSYWDPFKASGINFKIAENSDAFYDNLYDDICKELYTATGISFRVHEVHEVRRTEKGAQNILLIVHAPNGNTQTFPLNRQGFTVNEIINTIDQMSNNKSITTNDDLRNIVRFLAENGAKIQDIISFLLVCKMSGDVGCVYFLRNVAMPRKTIKAQYEDQPVIDFNVKNKPIMFLYTTDRLCGAIAIANDVKCVIKYKPLTEVFLCQYVGGGGSGSSGNGGFHEDVLEPYYEVINRICGYDLSLMSQEQKKIDLPKIYIKQFNKIFMNKTFNLHDIPHILHGPGGIREASDDEIIKYIIAIISLKDLKENLENTLEYIVRVHLKSQKLNITLLSISHIKALYNTIQKDGFFDPLLQYFMTTLIIPNEDIQKYVYNYISKKIKEKIGISLTDNYKMMSVLKQPLPETQNVAINQQEQLDIGMTDPLPAEGSKESKKRAPKLPKPQKPKE